MNTYWIIWTYIANYGRMSFKANSADDAVNMLYRHFSSDFENKATVYVFDKEPALVLISIRNPLSFSGMGRRIRSET
jgi:hypothetical protein